jgi:hypothetical protein
MIYAIQFLPSRILLDFPNAISEQHKNNYLLAHNYETRISVKQFVAC